MRFIFKTSSVTPDFFYVFNIILSFSTCSQSFKKKSVRGNFWARTSLSLGYVPVNSKTAHPPRANPGAFDFFEKFWSNSPLRCQLDGQMPHPLEFQRRSNPQPSRHVKGIPLKLFYYQTFFKTWRNKHS